MILPDPRALHNEYQVAKPFPHMVIKDLFPREVLIEASNEFDLVTDWRTHNHKHVANKYSLSDYEKIPETCKYIIDVLNSDVFVDWLSKLTGWRDLVADDMLGGAGLHMTTNGGFLDIHRDFSYQKYLKANRKLNVIIFLNPNFDHSWKNGDLELWSQERIGKRIPPVFGDMVIFNTIGNYHGHPYALNFPKGEHRKSIATYYYQPGKPEGEPHSTMYKYKDKK